MSDRTTQCERVRVYLETHDSINPLQAWTELGIYRLGARIFDLKKQGMGIFATRETVENRYGEKCNVGCYKPIRTFIAP